MTRVFLVDDHQLFLSGVRAELGGEVEVVGAASEVDNAIEMIRDRQPDVVLVDVHMPGGGGARVIREVLATHPDIRFLALSVSDAPEDVIATIRAGARGYLVKGAGGEEIVRAVVAVASGDAVYGGPVARRIVAFFAGEGDESPSVRAFPDLTPREREILDLLAIGCRNHEIARRLTMSEKTVRNHVSQVLMKLHVPDRTAAALRAREAGLGTPPMS